MYSESDASRAAAVSGPWRAGPARIRARRDRIETVDRRGWKPTAAGGKENVIMQTTIVLAEPTAFERGRGPRGNGRAPLPAGPVRERRELPAERCGSDPSLTWTHEDSAWWNLA
jgi:hypothetical protein